jgi:solute carrier family 50 protein (sugar transporter)
MKSATMKLILSFGCLLLVASRAHSFVPKRPNLPGHTTVGARKHSQKTTALAALPHPIVQATTLSTLVTTIVPKLGILTSTALYFCSAPSVYKTLQTNELGDVNPIPLVLSAFASLGWMAYGVTAQDPYVLLSNVPGCMVSIAYVVGVLPLINSTRKLRQTQTVVMSGVGATLSLWTYLALSSKSLSAMSQLLGMFASAIFCVLAASPLSTVSTVIQTKNASSILGAFTLAQVTNCLLWSAYGLSMKNVFVYGPNMVGLSLGLVQLALKILFPGGAGARAVAP